DMKPNDVTGVIESDFGCHIFRLDDVREALISVGLDDVREQIMNTLMLEKRKKAYREFIDSLKANADVKYKDETYLHPIESAPQTDTSGAYEDADAAEAP
ncbi:MAG: peptidylprolyl isomerase, partial [Candidatus Krumholzibacteria bacterium]|nr:peptidylprolyl isomerase [Candidatus Krumholzibacteria bacterium]